MYLEAARLQEAAVARSPPSPGPRRSDAARSSQGHALPRRHGDTVGVARILIIGTHGQSSSSDSNVIFPSLRYGFL